MKYAILHSSKNSNIVKFYDFDIMLKNFIKNLSNLIKSKYEFFFYKLVLSYLQSQLVYITSSVYTKYK